MGFERGNNYGSLSSRTGTPNKATKEIREKIDLIISEHIKTISSDLKKLDAKDRINFILQFLSFVVPKMKHIDLDMSDIQNNEVKPITIQVHERDKN